MSSPSSPKVLLASSPDGPVTAFDALTGTVLGRFNGGQSPRSGLALAGKSLIATSHVSLDTNSGSVYLHNWWSSTAFCYVPIQEPVAPLIATLDGSYLFCGGLSGHVHSLALPSCDHLFSFPAHSSPVSCFSINDDGSLLLTGGDDGTISVFPILSLFDSTSRHSAMCRLAGHASAVTAISVGMGGSRSTALSCSLDFTCKFWSLGHGSLMRTVVFPCMIWSVTMNSTESQFYAGGSDGHVYSMYLKIDKRQSRRVSELADPAKWEPGHGAAVTAVAMVNAGQHLVSASEDGCIRVWCAESKRSVRCFWNEQGRSISDLVVARRVMYSGGGGGFKGECQRHDFDGLSSEFSSREISRPVKEVSEMEETLKVTVKDRKRAVETLEAAIETYQRLLVLILKEANGGSGTNSNSNIKDSTED
ncbi:hypothetical protein Sjap_003831 [Stephania japonica]|uniref:Uncharacterized protein n=1 Tax=Stephania japonica TaxID=461633 RepID=A0AAP0KPK1_9MAGN